MNNRDYMLWKELLADCPEDKDSRLYRLMRQTLKEYRDNTQKEEVILRNRIQCKKCFDIIESMNRHDYKECKCGRSMVDGGYEYTRRGGVYTDMTVTATRNTPFKVIRDNLMWGTYGINGDKPLTYITLRDTSKAHLIAILDTQHNLNDFQRWAMEKELEEYK